MEVSDVLDTLGGSGTTARCWTLSALLLCSLSELLDTLGGRPFLPCQLSSAPFPRCSTLLADVRPLLGGVRRFSYQLSCSDLFLSCSTLFAFALQHWRKLLWTMQSSPLLSRFGQQLYAPQRHRTSSSPEADILSVPRCSQRMKDP